jgi:hypothetical protein
MRCRNHACRKRLGSKQEALVCSPACEAELLRYCELTLAVLKGEMRARDYPPDLRRQKDVPHRKERR